MTDGLRRAFGQPAPPASITQEAFDYDEAHLHRLVRLKPGERAVPGDLLDYAHDLRYTEIDKPLLAFLLPFCLEAWRDDLRGTIQPWLDELTHGHGLVKCYATEDSNPIKQLKNKLSQAAAARGGVLPQEWEYWGQILFLARVSSLEVPPKEGHICKKQDLTPGLTAR
jgi:hypothetical protein